MFSIGFRWVIVTVSAAAWLCLAGCAKQDRVARASSAGPAPVSGTAAKNLYRDGDILIAGEPTDAGLEVMQRAGVRTVIDLRAEPDKIATESDRVRKLGMEYVSIPMSSSTMTREQADALMAAMKRRKNGDVLIHCASGNRSGGAYGYYLGASGQCSIQEALERARKAGLRNEQLAEAVRAQLATRPSN